MAKRDDIMRPGNLKPGELYTCNGPASNGSFIVWDMSSEEIELGTNVWYAKDVLADCKSKWMFLEVKQVLSSTKNRNVNVYVFMATLFGGNMAAVLAGLDTQEVTEFIEDAHEK